MIVFSKNITSDFSSNLGFGGKGSSLINLVKQGIPVPMFFVLSGEFITSSFSTLIKDLKKKAGEYIAGKISEEDYLSIWQKYIENTVFPDTFKVEIEKAFKQLFKNDDFVSVRSSGLNEDGEKESFAGQFDTFLYVKKEELANTILKCVLSAFKPNVLRYSNINKLSGFAGIAVVVQKMLHSEKSGVLFTMNPSGNLLDTVIAAAYGLGEGVVADKADTDHFYVNRQTGNQRSEVNVKKIHVVYSVSEEKVIEADLPDKLSKEPVLSKKQVDDLFLTSKKIEKNAGIPQDIEFAFEDNKLYILQSRPITTIDFKNIKILDNSNIVESYPGITMPLTFSFARKAYENVFRSAGRLFQLPKSAYAINKERFENLIYHYKGRVYYNMHHWYRLVFYIVASKSGLKAWENLVGIRNEENDNLKVGFFKKIKIAFRFLFLLVNYKKVVSRFYNDFSKSASEIDAFISDINNKKLTEVYEFYEIKSYELFLKWAPTIVNDFFTFNYFDKLKSITTKLVCEKGENLTNDLLCGIEGVESEYPVMELLEIKEQILEHNINLNDFDDYDGFQVFLNKNDISLSEKISNYIKNYGDRVLEELKLESVSMKIDANIFLGMLKAQLSNPMTKEKIHENQLRIRKSAELEVENALQGKMYAKYRYNKVLKFCREAVKNRENMRLARTRAFGYVKQLFTYIGNEMHESGLLQHSGDVFYLKDFEVKKALTDNNFANTINQLIAERKSEFNLYKNIELPDKILYSGKIVPECVIGNENIEFDENDLSGLSVFGGKVIGTPVVLSSPDLSEPVKGKILVTKMTDPAWVFLMSQAAGIISEKGSLLSHTAIVGRELGIPTVVGVANAVNRLIDAKEIELDASKGIVRILACVNN